MKKYIVYLILLLSVNLYSQIFGSADNSCSNVNANSSIYSNVHDIAKRATVNIGANCTGTLVNRKVQQDNLGFFMITSSHCFNQADLDNPNKEYELFFNYESPTSVSTSTPISNRGEKRPTGTIPPQEFFQSNKTHENGGYQYYHKTKMRVVANFTSGIKGGIFGDFLLLEILKPIPPHFNVAYAGWYPGMAVFFPGINNYAYNYVNYAHPKGDIKKFSNTSTTISVTGATTGALCRSVTKVIDAIRFLFGGTSKTESVCRFFETQTVWVPFFQGGGVEGGSSGSALLSSGGNILGNMSFTFASTCFNSNAYFSKFRVAYYREEVRNVLNPSNDFWVDQFGISGRLINCYSSLNNLNGEYFAGRDYNLNSGITSNGRINLRSESTITTNGSLRIHPGADYSFTAGQTITLNPGFEVVIPRSGETMGVFEARTASCVVPRSDEKSNDIPSDVMRKARNLELPQFKPFNPQQFLNKDNGLVDLDAQSEIQAYPNPSSDGNFTVRFVVDAKKSVNLAFTDILGKTIYATKYSCIQGENYFPLDMSGKGISEGMYFIIVDDGATKKVKKVIIK
jgi:hypothetical protein